MNIAKAVALLIASYPNVKMELTNTEAYKYWLKQIPEDQLERCLRAAMLASGNFAPTGPAIVAMYHNSKQQAVKIDAEMEWQKVMAHTRRYEICGPIGSPAVELSPQGMRAYRVIGGFEAVCSQMQDGAQWLDKMRRTFVDAWEQGNEYPQLTAAETRGMLAIADHQRNTEGDPKELVPVDTSMLLRAAGGVFAQRVKVIDMTSEEIEDRRRELAAQLEAARKAE